METIQQKFAMFIGSLTPDEQRAVAPLMQIFSSTMSGPQQGQGLSSPPPPAPPGADTLKPPAAPQTAVPGGPPLPPPDPAAMSIGRQMY